MKRFKWPSTMRVLSNQSGLSIIHVLVMLGFFGLAFASMNKAMVNELIAKKSLVASSSYTNVHKDLKMELVSRILDNLGPNCLANVSRAFRGSKVGEDSDLYPFRGRGPQDPRLRGPQERCKKPRKTANSQYFCLQVAKDPNSPKNSFTNGSKDALLEVYVEFQNIAGRSGDSTISCQDFVNQPSSENLIKVFYSLYWTIDSGGKKTISKRRNGIFYGHSNS